MSFVVRDAEEKRHKRGVNALQLDHNNGRLFSAGRDAIVSYKMFFLIALASQVLFARR